jgi:hypothetical protein
MKIDLNSTEKVCNIDPVNKRITWAMKIGATASYSAEPFMLTVAPIGRTNLVTRGSILFFVSSVSIET